MGKDVSTTKNTYIHTIIDRKCAISGCPIQADLVSIKTTYLSLNASYHICQKHLGGKQ